MRRAPLLGALLGGLLVGCGGPPVRTFRTTKGVGLSGAIFAQVYEVPDAACQVEFGCVREPLVRGNAALSGRYGWRPSTHIGLMAGGFFDQPRGQIIDDGEFAIEPRIWGMITAQGENVSIGLSPEVGTKSAGASIGLEVYGAGKALETMLPGLHLSYRYIHPYEPRDLPIDAELSRWDARVGVRFMGAVVAASLEGSGGAWERSIRAERRWSMLLGFDVPVGELPEPRRR